jgi:hypothetical protein
MTATHADRAARRTRQPGGGAFERLQRRRAVEQLLRRIGRLVRARELRRRRGAGQPELEQCDATIARLQWRLADLVRGCAQDAR